MRKREARINEMRKSGRSDRLLETNDQNELDNFYREVVEKTSDVIFALSAEGIFTSLNPAFEEATGFSPSEWVGKSLASLIHPEDLAIAVANTRRVMEGRSTTTHDYRILTKSGKYINTEIKSVPHVSMGNLIGIMGIARDISDRIRKEETIREREEQFRSVAETATDSIISVNDEGKIIFWNRAAEETFGYSAKEIEGSPVSLIIPARFREAHAQGISRLAAGGAPRILGKTLEISAICKEGTEFPVELSLARWNSGEKIYFTAIIRDITERKASETKMAESESKYRAVTEKSLVGVYIIQDGVFQYVNQMFAKILGYSYDEIVGRMSPEDFTHPDYRELLRENIRRRLEGEIDSINYELMLVTKKGSSFPAKVFGSVSEYRGKPAIMGTLLDLSRENELEKQLLHSQKMEAIGQLAGGIAHDFNNMLTAIIGFASILKMKMDKDLPESDQVDQILAAAERGSSLTQSLLAFSRKQEFDFISVNINNVIGRGMDLIKRIVGEDIRLSVIPTEETLAVLANEGQIDQVLMNLTVNARDAMPEGGEIKIETEKILLDDEFVRGQGHGKPGDYALIKVTDTGVGMDEETREKIFEPFFTTKGVGKGTGLGLSIVYGIIAQHGGFITVQPGAEGGTTFMIYLPISGENEEKRAFPRKHDDLSGEESILIAEDDSTIRDVFVDVLTRFGYEVIGAVNGREALQKYHEKGGSIDILLFDVIMPEMNGWEAYLRIREIDPEAKVIFMSAYTADTIEKQGLLEKGVRLLPKPLSPVEMLKTVREVLDR